jgi:hypothetical protein
VEVAGELIKAAGTGGLEDDLVLGILVVTGDGPVEKKKKRCSISIGFVERGSRGSSSLMREDFDATRPLSVRGH